MAEEASRKSEQIEREVKKIDEAVKEIERLNQDHGPMTDATRPPGKPTTDPPAERPKDEK